MGETPGSVRRALEALLNGFDFYAHRERVGQDDLLVRNTVAEDLEACRQALRQARTLWAHAPELTPTRERPTPDPQAMEALRQVERLEREAEELATLVRTAPLPPTDRLWRRLRDDQALLELVLAHDWDMVSSGRTAREEARRMAQMSAPSQDAVAQALARIRKSLWERQNLMRPPGL
jgi:hypothetical protein